MQVLSERITALITVIQSYPPPSPPSCIRIALQYYSLSPGFSNVFHRNATCVFSAGDAGATRDPSEGEEPVRAPGVCFVRGRKAE